MKKVLEKYRNSEFFEIRYMSPVMIVFFLLLLFGNLFVTQVLFENSVVKEYEKQLTVIEEVVDTIESKEDLYESYLIGVNAAMTLNGGVDCEVFSRYISTTGFSEVLPEVSAVGLHLVDDGSNTNDLKATLHCIYPNTEEFQGFIGIDTFRDDENKSAGRLSVTSDGVVMTELFELASGNQGFVMYLYNDDLKNNWTAMALRYEPYFRDMLSGFEYNMIVKGPSSIDSGADFVVFDNLPTNITGLHSISDRFDMFDKPFEITIYFESTSEFIMYFVLFTFVMIFFVILRSYYKLYMDLKIKKLI